MGVEFTNPKAGRFARFLANAEECAGDSPFAAALAGLPVLVTGAGGCIGSALVRAIAAAGPARLVLLDSSEAGLFRTVQALEAGPKHIACEAVLGSVNDAALLDRIFGRFAPAAVYHAAALKHVPLAERNPLAAVRTNALGTYALAQATARHGASRLVLVSTDKAVNPHSIMGASKRLAELTMAALGTARCRMNAVRLGNVIGSSGSVVPIFLERIAGRRPVPVTHPEATRYFISLRGAVDAILAAGAAECSGRILLPDLGGPERILDLARFFVESAGRGEIPVEIVGLRPGEKLHEELTYRTETREAPAGPLHVVRTPAPSAAALDETMRRLACQVDAGNLAGLLETVSSVIPEYEPSPAVLACARTAEAAR